MEDSRNTVGLKPCSECGNNHWITPNELNSISSVEDNLVNPLKGLEVVHSICANCGHIKFFASERLRKHIKDQLDRV